VVLRDDQRPTLLGRSSVALLFGQNLSPRELVWLLYSYLGIFGLNLFALSTRMLFAVMLV
jgi:hypothetical protein